MHQITANFILGMANLNNPSYTIERWHVVLLCYLLAILAAAVNALWSRFLNQISTFAVVLEYPQLLGRDYHDPCCERPQAACQLRLLGFPE